MPFLNYLDQMFGVGKDPDIPPFTAKELDMTLIFGALVILIGSGLIAILF